MYIPITLAITQKLMDLLNLNLAVVISGPNIGLILSRNFNAFSDRKTFKLCKYDPTCNIEIE